MPPPDLRGREEAVGLRGTEERPGARIEPPQGGRADDETALDLIETAGELISDLGGEAEAPDSVRDRVALFSTGLLLVLSAYARDIDVTSYQALLRRKGHRVTRVLPVSMDVLQRAHVGSAQEAAGSIALTANMQKEILREVSAAAREQVSDIHVEWRRGRTLVRWRIAGDLMAQKEWPGGHGERFLQAAYAMARNGDATYVESRPQYAQITNADAPLPEGVNALRLTFAPMDPSGRVLVIRLLYSGAGEGDDLVALGYDQSHAELLDDLLGLPDGIVAVTGPTGSGKSTSLQRYMKRFLKRTGGRKRLITVEDPPEREIPGAIQIPVTSSGADIDRSQAMQEAINAMMRLDPDAGMVGEIRDLPTASLAIRMAMTGHPVSTTLHTNDALSAIDRLLDMGVESYKVLDPFIVRGLVAQRLIRLVCPHCSFPAIQGFERGQIPERGWSRLLSVADPTCHDVRMAGRGCRHCHGGYLSQRTVVAEIVLPDAHLMSLMSEHRKAEARGYWLNALGGSSMMEHAVAKLRSGILDQAMIELSLGPLRPEPFRETPEPVFQSVNDAAGRPNSAAQSRQGTSRAAAG